MGGVSLCTSLCEDRTRQQSSPCSRAHLRAHRVLCRQQHGPFPSHPLLHCLLKGRRTALLAQKQGSSWHGHSSSSMCFQTGWEPVGPKERGPGAKSHPGTGKPVLD